MDVLGFGKGSLSRFQIRGFLYFKSICNDA